MYIAHNILTWLVSNHEFIVNQKNERETWFTIMSHKNVHFITDTLYHQIWQRVLAIMSKKYQASKQQTDPHRDHDDHHENDEKRGDEQKKYELCFYLHFIL